jgi:hypothetical protein
MPNTKEPPAYNKHLNPTLRVGAEFKFNGFDKPYLSSSIIALFRRSV